MPDISNAAIAELLAIKADTAKMPLQKALRRASRRAFLWPEEAAGLVRQHRSLTELAGIGPSLSKLVMEWIEQPPSLPDPPAIRKWFLTITEAKEVLCDDPTCARSLRGDLQMHTLWSDGSGSILEMARAAQVRGYEYIAITDHSKGLKIAGGIDEKQLQQQSDEIESVNVLLRSEGVHLMVLRSIELNLNPIGEGDMDRQFLNRLDLVLGCFHSSLRKKEDQTERYLAALRNPDIQILGHPQGRIYNFREGLVADWKRVFDTAAELNKAVEIDGYPDRQDLSVDLLEIARASGCRISLGTDSHDPQQMRFIDFALAAAIKAGIRRDRILNFLSAEDLQNWAAALRGATS